MGFISRVEVEYLFYCCRFSRNEHQERVGTYGDRSAVAPGRLRTVVCHRGRPVHRPPVRVGSTDELFDTTVSGRAVEHSIDSLEWRDAPERTAGARVSDDEFRRLPFVDRHFPARQLRSPLLLPLDARPIALPP